jgi:hypothetical protein
MKIVVVKTTSPKYVTKKDAILEILPIYARLLSGCIKTRPKIIQQSEK